jgi:hypothetical protein
LGRGGCGQRGGLYGGHCMAEGLGFNQIGEESGEDLARVHRVCPGISGRDDKRDPEVSDGRERGW